MEFSFDILDYIFGFLKSDSKSLIACSKAHPVFSPIVERHLYYHIIIPTSPDFGVTDHGYCLEPSDLIQLLSETPQIANHVRILRIALCECDPSPKSPSFEQIALILPIFPALECIMLTNDWNDFLSWQDSLPQSLKTAVEDCLRLPTLQEVHIGNLEFPLSVLNNHANINYFSLSDSLQLPDFPDDTYLTLKSLAVEDMDHPNYCTFFSTWAKRHIIKLQSLKCDCNHSSEQMILEFLEICSGTLNNLDLRLQSPYETTYYINTGKVVPHFNRPRIPLINLSSLPHLQHLTIRVDVCHTDFQGYVEEYYMSSLPSAVEILKTASSLQHLTIGICLEDHSFWAKLNFAPLKALAKSPASFHHIDLYIMDITHTRIVSKLSRYKSLKKLIKQGVLVIHAEETAPGNSRYVW